MRYAYYSETEFTTYPVTLLINAINKDEIAKAYIGEDKLDKDDVVVLTLETSGTKKKLPVAIMKQWIKDELVPVLEEQKTEYIFCADADYFKVLTGQKKADANLGYILPCLFGDYKVLFIPTWKQIFYNPENVKWKIQRAIDAYKKDTQGSYEDPGANIIGFSAYPESPGMIKEWLNKLLEMDVPLSIDIEAFSLKHPTSGIATISFAWSKSQGIAFPVDWVNDLSVEGLYGRYEKNPVVHALLKSFFKKFLKKSIYHNISFDVYILIYQLFMKDLLDTEGLLEGMKYMLRDWDCTKLISYLATNSCAGNELSLKAQAQEYAGNYAVEDIKDIRLTPLKKLLEYNLVDSLCSWHVHEKNYPIMVQDDQLDIYENIFKPAIPDIVQMQLTGLPVDMERVAEVKKILQKDSDTALDKIRYSPLVQEFTYFLNEKYVEKKNLEYKKKRITLADSNEVFNPSSPDQLVELLFNKLYLPVLSTTKTGQPETGAEVLKALINHTENQNIKDLLLALADFKAVNKMLTTVIPALEGAFLAPDGWHYMYGNFNLGGAVSGRLSSSKPNLQNIPASGTIYGKLIKSCFKAPKGWLFGGLDFDSLEDKISAVTTKDPNKIKVYTDGYDGHCLRTFTYFKDQLPGIVDTLESINSIAKKFPQLRYDSKAPTFALTYQGTWATLVKNCGFTPEFAQEIEAKYKLLYSVSIAWIQSHLDNAAKTGYVTVAFGLRVRTPKIAQTILGSKSTPKEAAAEGRTAGNAMGQSWCLLNTRAASEFNSKVRKSKYRLDIKPCAHIHDAQYFLFRDDIDTIIYTNEHLVKAVEWQEHPVIKSNDVKITGTMFICWPTWAKEMEIPNNSTESEIFSIVDKFINKE